MPNKKQFIIQLATKFLHCNQVTMSQKFLEYYKNNWFVIQLFLDNLS